MTIVLALTAGPVTTTQLATRTRQPLTTIRHHLTTLTGQGTIERTGDHWKLAVSLPEAVSRQITTGQKHGGPPAQPPPCDAGPSTTPQEAP